MVFIEMLVDGMSRLAKPKLIELIWLMMKAMGAQKACLTTRNRRVG